MSEINPEPTLIEERAAELDKWWAINFVRFMNSQDPSPTLSDMRTEVIYHVLEKMEPMELLTLRKVCRRLRNCIDKFGIHFEDISFEMCNDRFELQLDQNLIGYMVTNDGTTIVYNEQIYIVEGEDFVNIAYNDIHLLLKSPVATLKFSISSEEKCLRFLVYTIFMEFLSSLENIYVEHLILSNFTFDSILSILPLINADVLENIELSNFRNVQDFERITRLEQWSKAKTVDLSSNEIKLSQLSLETFSHFEKIWLELNVFSKQDAIKLRDILQTPSKLNLCVLIFPLTSPESILRKFVSWFTRSNLTPIEVAEVFQQDYDGDNEIGGFRYSTDVSYFGVLCTKIDNKCVLAFVKGSF